VLRRLLGLVPWVVSGMGVLALIAGTALPAPASATPSPRGAGSIGIRLLDAPASLAGDPRAKAYIIDHLAPGTTIQRHVQVSNTTASTVHLLLYGGAASITAAGWVADGSEGGNELAGWITVSPSSETLPPGGSATAQVTIAVPLDAAAGERYAVVWADLPPVAGSGQVAIANLVGVRVYLSVGPGGVPPSDFAIDGVTALRTPQGPELLVAVHNTGERALDLGGTALLTGGPGKLSAGPFNALGSTLGIGASTGIVIPLDPATPSGAWNVAVTLASGLVSHSVTAQIVIPSAVQASPSEAAVHAVPSSSPGILGLSGRHLDEVAGAVSLAVVLVLLLLLFLTRRRHRKDEPPPVEAAPLAVAAERPPPAPPTEPAEGAHKESGHGRTGRGPKHRY
jgi:hypothetical protein